MTIRGYELSLVSPVVFFRKNYILLDLVQRKTVLSHKMVVLVCRVHCSLFGH